MWIVRPIYLLKCDGLRQFLVRMLAQQFAVKILVAILLVLLLPESPETDRSDALRNPLAAIVFFVVIAPVLETLLLQSIPIEACRATRRPKWFQFLSGWLPFAALHFSMGVMAGVAAGVVGGAFFSHTYLECRARSWWTSVAITMALHSLHNLAAMSLLFLHG